MYPKLTVYYFTGTGNSLKVALWLTQTAKEMNMETELINIATIDLLQQHQLAPDTLVAFVSPVHGFNYPPVMLHFGCKPEKKKSRDLLSYSTIGVSRERQF